MREIIGNTTATPNPRPDWNQTDASKADYIKNKPDILTEDGVIQLIEEHGGGVKTQSDWNQADDTKADYIKNKPDIASLQNSLESLDTALTSFSETTLPAFENRVEAIETSKADKATTLFGYGITDAAGLNSNNTYTAHNVFMDTVYFGGEDGWIAHDDGTLEIKNDIGALRLCSDEGQTLTISDVVSSSATVEAPFFIEDGVLLQNKYMRKTKLTLAQLQSGLSKGLYNGCLIQLYAKNAYCRAFVQHCPTVVPDDNTINAYANCIDLNTTSVFEIRQYHLIISGNIADLTITAYQADLVNSEVVAGSENIANITDSEMEFYLIA